MSHFGRPHPRQFPSGLQLPPGWDRGDVRFEVPRDGAAKLDLAGRELVAGTKETWPGEKAVVDGGPVDPLSHRQRLT